MDAFYCTFFASIPSDMMRAADLRCDEAHKSVDIAVMPLIASAAESACVF